MNSGLLGYNGNVMFNGAGYPMYAVDSTGPKHWDVTGTGLLTYGQNYTTWGGYSDNGITTNYMLAHHNWAYAGDNNMMYIRTTATKFSDWTETDTYNTSNWRVLDTHDYPGDSPETWGYDDPKAFSRLYNGAVSAHNFSECRVSGTLIVEPVLKDDTTVAMDAYWDPQNVLLAHVEYNDLVNGKWTIPFDHSLSGWRPFINIRTSGDQRRVFNRRRETPYAWGDIKVYQTPVNIYINR